MSKSSGFTIGPMGIIIIIILFNWVTKDDDTGNSDVDEVRTEVNTIVGNVINEVKVGVEEAKIHFADTTKIYDASNNFQEEFPDNIEWAEEDF